MRSCCASHIGCTAAKDAPTAAAVHRLKTGGEGKEDEDKKGKENPVGSAQKLGSSGSFRLMNAALIVNLLPGGSERWRAGEKP